jgi:hypothetical protein
MSEVVASVEINEVKARISSDHKSKDWFVGFDV